MRLAVRTCYDFLRSHQRNREAAFSDLTDPEDDWLERFIHQPGPALEDSDAARQLVQRVLQQLSPPARLVITLLEIEDRVGQRNLQTDRVVGAAGEKVRAFRARAEMRKILAKIAKDKYL